jgi:hypothetical protein
MLYRSTATVLSTRRQDDDSGRIWNKIFQRTIYTLYPQRSEAFSTFSNKLIIYGELSRRPNPHAGGPPLVGCPRLLIQYIRSFPPYLEGVSIRSLRTRRAVVTKGPPNMRWESQKERDHWEDEGVGGWTILK